MNEPLISVVIPVFNTPIALFKDCVNSIVSQDYKNLEILVIDDGSEESYANLIEKTTEIDDRIQIIHQKNAGEGAARNTGIENAKGEYIVFVDSDDGLAPDWLKFSSNCAQNGSYDVVAGKVLRVNKVPSDFSVNDHEITAFFDKDNLWQVQRDSFYFSTNLVPDLKILDPGVCSKLFKRRLFQKIRFPIGIKLSSDQVVNHKIISIANSYCITDRESYFYVTNDQSISHIYQPKAIDYMMQSMSLVKKYLIKNAYVYQAFYYRVLAEVTEGIQYAYFSDKHQLSFKEKVKGVRYASNQKLVEECLRKLDYSTLPERSWKVKAFLLKYRMNGLFTILKIVSDFADKRNEQNKGIYQKNSLQRKI